MTFQDPQTPVKPENKEAQPLSSEVRDGLEHLRERVPEKPSVMGMIQNIKNYFSNLEPAQKKQIAAIVSTAIFGLLFEGEKKDDEETKEAAQNQSLPEDKTEDESTEEDEEEDEEDENDEEEGVEDEEELVSRPKRSKVVCDEADLICINTDPAASRRPDFLKGRSSYLCEYGLPEYGVFKEEMIGFLAPDEPDEEKAMKKVLSVLRSSPMGKYQCMPQYLFDYVEEFKSRDLKWDKPNREKQAEEKLHAMWEFLQNEDMQRRACTGFVESIVNELKAYKINGIKVFNGDPAYIFASYYGGTSAGKALLARDTNTANAKQKARVAKKQGDYISIEKYAGKQLTEEEKKKREDGRMVILPPVPTPSIAAIVNQIATKESGNLRNVKSKPRDEQWEKDQRYAYNKTAVA